MYKFALFLLAGCVCMTAQESSSVAVPPTVQVPDFPVVAAGQDVAVGPVMGETLNRVVHLLPAPPVTGAPYSADTNTEIVQTLADGNRIDQTTTGTVARDSQGRTRIERTLPEPVKFSNGKPRQLITISDPVAGYMYALDPVRKIAHRMPMRMGPVTAQALQSRLQTKLDKAASAGGGNFAKTDLGTQTINGVSAQGTKITRTIPAGAIGNENPITSTTETWYSPDLKAVVMSKSDDPRFGETTYQLTNIVQGEPSPDLFQVPSDYTIQDGPGKDAISLQKAQ